MLFGVTAVAGLPDTSKSFPVSDSAVITVTSNQGVTMPQQSRCSAINSQKVCTTHRWVNKFVIGIRSMYQFQI